MDLPRKFEDATSSRSINIIELDRDKKYPIVSAKRFTTKFGPTSLLTIHDSDSLNIFLPKRYSEVISDDDIDKINKNSISLNLIYKTRVQNPDLTCWQLKHNGLFGIC